MKRDSVIYALLDSISFEIFAEVDSTGQVPFSFLGPVLLFWREKRLILKISQSVMLFDQCVPWVGGCLFPASCRQIFQHKLSLPQ